MDTKTDYGIGNLVYFVIYLCSLVVNIPTAGAATPPVAFADGEMLTHTKLNKNFDLIANAQTHGSGYIPNTSWEIDTKGWVLAAKSTGTINRVAIEGPAGAHALQNEAGTMVWVGSSTWFNLDHSKSYRVTGTFRATLGASGGIYLVVRLKDQSGNEISSKNTGWFSPANGAIIPLNQWTHFKADFGAGTAQEFPVNARYASIATILNYDAATDAAGDRTYQVQGLGIYDGEKGPESRWQDLGLNVPVVAFGGEFQVPQFRKVGDQVCLRGLANDVPPTPDVHIATLPIGYRPPARLLFSTVGSLGSGETTTGDRVDILPTGNVLASRIDAVVWLAFDGICFSTTP